MVPGSGARRGRGRGRGSRGGERGGNNGGGLEVLKVCSLEDSLLKSTRTVQYKYCAWLVVYF